jgi:c-di-GMP-binding flagellar brake protein YcgR
MKLYRRHDKRIGFEERSAIACQLVHPHDHLICLRGHLLDLGAGGIGLRIGKSDVPGWVIDEPVIVRADLPGTGELLRRMARMRNQRREGEQPEYGFIWDARGALSRAYERVQSQRLQRFLLRRERDLNGQVELTRFGDDGEPRLLALEAEAERGTEIVRLERLPASLSLV